MLLRQTKNLSPGARRASKAIARAAGFRASGLRPAATLTEVLVAIFVMGIGLLALLSLFPLGALTMAQAIKDDQTAHAAKSAFAFAEMFNIHNDLLVYNVSPLGIAVFAPTPPATSPPANSPSFFLNPYPPIPQAPFTLGLPPDLAAASWDGPSYPIYVDPRGSKFLGSQQVGNSPTASLPAPPNGPALIPRIPLSGADQMGRPQGPSLTTNQAIQRWCTLMDDITFADTGLPNLTNTGGVQRQGYYSWAWMIRRPKANVPSVVDVSVVVYSGRSLASLGETVYPGVFFGAYFDVTQNPPLVTANKFVDLPYPVGSPPPVRRGSWILDATLSYSVQTANGPANIPDPHGFFYRVVEVTDIGLLPSAPNGPYPPNTNGLRLELQSNFRNQKATFTGTVNQPTPYGVLVVMENVAEVFEKGSGWKP